MKTRHLVAGVLLGSAGLLAGCPSLDLGSDTELRADFEQLPELDEDQVYEGWIIADGDATSIFRADDEDIDDLGPLSLNERFLEEADRFVLTIEPEADHDPAMSDTRVLAGDFQGPTAQLTLDEALELDLSGASGTYILNTPTTDTVEDYDQGIWYLDPSGGAARASLDLPPLMDGWVYEGWVVLADGTKISTGTFLAPDEPDDNGAGPDAGTLPAPPFPGEDFIDPPLVLTGHQAVVTLEPSPDTGPGPSGISVLVATIVDGGPNVMQPLSNHVDETAPSGLVWFDLDRDGDDDESLIPDPRIW